MMLKIFLYAYCVGLGAIPVITGDVSLGKSTALRYASGGLHPSEYHVIPAIASTGSVVEVFRQICISLDINWNSTSLTRLMHTIRETVTEIGKRRQVPVLIIDEASLLRLEVFAQLHTLGQFEMDSKPILPIILAGQNISSISSCASRPGRSPHGSLAEAILRD